jgi:hypothetical protein
MSGYPDDPDRDPRDDEEAIRVAKSAVVVPAIGLICLGALTVFFAIIGFIQLQGLPGKFDEMIKQVQADPNIPAQQKQQQVEIWTKIRDFLVDYGAILYGISLLGGLIMLVGGIRFRSLNNPGLVVIGALASMFPFTSWCCFLGLVFGIWALIALMNPTVKAGFAARRRMGYTPDAP